MLEKSMLLDPDRKYYAYVSKGMSMIFTDEDNMELGKVKGFSLFENNGSLILTMKIKSKLFYKSEYSIFDSQGNILGIVKKTGDLGLFHMVDSNEKELLLGEIPSVHDVPYSIHDGEGKEVASITRIRGKWYHRIIAISQMIMQIKDSSHGRVTLLGFVIALSRQWTDEHQGDSAG